MTSTQVTYNVQCNFDMVGCFDYLCDHHNRDNEQLLVAYLHPDMSRGDLVDELYDSVVFLGACKIPTEISDEQIMKAIDDMLPENPMEVIQETLSVEDWDEIGLFAHLVWEVN